MSKIFTKNQKKEYIDALGMMCPYCHSKNINTPGNIEGDDDGGTSQELECYDCGKSWMDIYTLTDILPTTGLS